MGVAAERCETMDRTEKTRRRLRRALVGIAAAGGAAALLASPTLAAGAVYGNATIRPAVHGSGRTLSGQGVEILAGAGASTAAGVITLPIDSLEAGGTASWARSPGALSFVHGKDSLTLSGIRFDLAEGTLEGSLGGRRLAVFRLGAAVDIDPATGSVGFIGGRLRLTDAAAMLLRTRLGLERALVHRGVGQVSMGVSTGATETTPLPPGCKPPPPPTILYPKPPPPPEDCLPDPSPEVPPPPAPTL